jgi:hypothetical protein
MKIKVTPQTLTMLNTNLHKILMIRDDNNVAQLYVVVEVESIEEEDVEEINISGGFFSKHKTKIVKVSNTYITHIAIETMHPTGKFLGVISDEACERFITWYDIYRLRENWLYMVEQIRHMGFDLTRIEKPKMIIDNSGSMKPTIPNNIPKVEVPPTATEQS